MSTSMSVSVPVWLAYDSLSVLLFLSLLYLTYLVS